MTEPDEALLWARENSPPHIYVEQANAANAYRAGAAASAERIKALEARVAELERRLSGGAAAGAAVATGTIYSIPDGCYFENGKAMYGGRGGGGQG